MRRIAVCLILTGLVAGCGSGEEYNNSPPEQLEPPAKPKPNTKPKVINTVKAQVPIK